MIIDCHVHVKGGDRFRREFPPERIVRCMDEAGIDKSIVFSICLPTPEANDLTRRAVAQFPDRLIPFAHINPDDGPLWPVWLEQACGQMDVRGVKLHFGVLKEASTEVLEPVVAKIEDAKLPILVDCKEQYELMREFTERHDGTMWIIAHLGSPRDEVLVDRFAALARERPHVFLDTSYSHCPWKIADAIRWAGHEKVVFGSDGPLIHPAIELAKIDVCGLAPGERENVLAGNIARIIGLDPL
ncbi:MAG: amidohydrolase family protein [Armatimonadota bacterium]